MTVSLPNPSSRLLRAAVAEQADLVRHRERLTHERARLLGELRRLDEALAAADRRLGMLAELAGQAEGSVAGRRLGSARNINRTVAGAGRDPRRRSASASRPRHPRGRGACVARAARADRGAALPAVVRAARRGRLPHCRQGPRRGVPDPAQPIAARAQGLGPAACTRSTVRPRTEFGIDWNGYRPSCARSRSPRLARSPPPAPSSWAPSAPADTSSTWRSASRSARSRKRCRCCTTTGATRSGPARSKPADACRVTT